MSSESYKVIIDRHLTPFMREFNGGNCRLLQDNAPTHVTDLIYETLRANGIRWVSKCLDIFVINMFYTKVIIIINIYEG